jgi:hypothetical protein
VEEGFWSATGDDAVTSHTITLSDSEYREVTAALELMIDHCDAFAAMPRRLVFSTSPELPSHPSKTARSKDGRLAVNVISIGT